MDTDQNERLLHEVSKFDRFALNIAAIIGGVGSLVTLLLIVSTYMEYGTPIPPVPNGRFGFGATFFVCIFGAGSAVLFRLMAKGW